MSNLDIITDPVTGKKYSRDPSIAGSTYAPYTPPAEVQPPADPTKDLVTKAAKAGVGVKDLPSVLPPADTNAIRDELAKTYGYGSFDDFTRDVFTRPSRATQDLYDKAYKTAGLDQLLGKITQKQNELNQATSAINENPWLSEASRSGRLGRLNALALTDINNLKDLYKTHLDEVHNLVTLGAQDISENEQMKAAKLDFLLKQAETEAAQRQATAFSKYLPDYLSAAPGQKPDTITVGDSVYTWNPDTGKFEVAIQGSSKGKFTQIGTDEYGNTMYGFVNEQTGQVTPYSGQAGGSGAGVTGPVSAQQVVDAIRQIEGASYSQRGASGELGQFQFMPATWAQYSKEYAQANGIRASLANTPENQEKVATFKVQQWLDQGMTPDQIFSMWNHGSPDYKGVKGVNKQGVAYDTEAYVARGLQALSSGSTGQVYRLPPKVQASVDQIVNQFDGEPVVKNYNEVQNKYLSMQAIINAGVGGPGDLAAVYDFMKALDPTSVVRESEYASAAKSGNIFQGSLARFNGYLKEKGGILPENVKTAFLSIVQKKLDVASAQYKNVYNEYGRRINLKTGRQNGTDYLTDYSKALDTVSPSSNAGRIVNVNGQRYQVAADGDTLIPLQ